MKYFHQLLLLILIISVRSLAQTGFSESTIYNGSEIITGMTFDEAGRIYFWEKTGKIWVIKDGIKSSTPLLDLTSEVRNALDLGLIGVVLDPDYMSNGYIYFCYAIVESSFSGYNPNDPATMGRVTRYTVDDPNVDYPTAQLASRKVLLGTEAGDGFPITFVSHMGGALAFGDDGSLMLSTGDGATFVTTDNGNQGYYQHAISLGIMSPAENVGANRSQLDSSMCGKILRIDPETGDAMKDNPLYDSANPRSAVSRLWAKGLRNPWRMLHIPNSGNHDNPGAFLVGDVGSSYYEELNLVSEPNLNFGWPHYEGMDYFFPARPTQYKPSQWQKPIIDLKTGVRGLIDEIVYPGGSPQFPAGSFAGSSAIVLGNFYTRNDFPVQYQNAFFFGDHGSRSIFYTKLDSNYNPMFFYQFRYTGDYLFDIQATPYLEGLFYIVNSNSYTGGCKIKRLKYAPGNQAPVANISAENKTSGSNTLTTQFSAKFSYDPNPGDILSFNWSFGDGQTATGLAPNISFSSKLNVPVTYKVVLTVSDNHGSSSKDSLYVTLNNEAPTIKALIIDPVISQLKPSTETDIYLETVATDDYTPANNLVYKWYIFELHNGHQHLHQTYIGNQISIQLPEAPCESPNASYWIKIKLEVIDEGGLISTEEVIYEPDCGKLSQNISFNQISEKNTNQTSFTLNATSNSELDVEYYILNGPAIVLGNSCSLSGIPGVVTLRATQHGNAQYNPALFVEQTFDVVKYRTPQTIVFKAIPNQINPQYSLILDAASNLNRPVKFVKFYGPINIVGGQVTFTGEGGWAKVRAYNEGDDNVEGAYQDMEFYVCPLAYYLTNPENNVNSSSEIEFKALENITSDAILNNGSKVIYNAGNFIHLLPGFQVKHGAVFETTNTGCSD